MIKFFTYILFFALSSNMAFSESKTINTIIKQTIENNSPRLSKTKSSARLAKDFLKSVGLNKGDNGDIFIAVGTAILNTKNLEKVFRKKTFTCF